MDILNLLFRVNTSQVTAAQQQVAALGSTTNTAAQSVNSLGTAASGANSQTAQLSGTVNTATGSFNSFSNAVGNSYTNVNYYTKALNVVPGLVSSASATLNTHTNTHNKASVSIGNTTKALNGFTASANVARGVAGYVNSTLSLTPSIASTATSGFATLSSGLTGVASGMGLVGSAVLGATVVLGTFAVAATAVLAAVIPLASAAINAADHFDEMSDRTNISATRLQLLDVAAKLGGASLDELIQSSESLSAKLAKQDEETGKVTNAIKALDVEQKNADGTFKSSLQLQEDIVMAVKKKKDALNDAKEAGESDKKLTELSNQVTIAQSQAVTALGAQYWKLAPAIEQTAEKKGELYDRMVRTNQLISGPFAKSSGDFKDSLDRLSGAFGGIGNSIAEFALPGIQGFVSWVTQGIEKVAELVKQLLGLSTGSETYLKKIQDIDEKIASKESKRDGLRADAANGKSLFGGNWFTSAEDKLAKTIDGEIKNLRDQRVRLSNAYAEERKKAEEERKKALQGEKGEGTGTAGGTVNIPTAPKAEQKIAENPITKDIANARVQLAQLESEYAALLSGRTASTNVDKLEAAISAGKYDAKYAIDPKTGKEDKTKMTQQAATPEELQKMREVEATKDKVAAMKLEEDQQNRLADAADSAIRQEELKLQSYRDSIEEQKIADSVLREYGTTQADVTVALTEYRLQKIEDMLTDEKRISLGYEEIRVLEAKRDVLKQTLELNKSERQRKQKDDTSQNTYTDGWNKAFKDFEKAATDSASAGRKVFESFAGATEDAIYNAMTTGKASFSDFAKSVLSDIARIATKQAALWIFKSMGLFANGGVFGSSVSENAKGGVFSSGAKMFAKGGAFTGGVEAFANGGSFTNNVYDKPTMFAMSNGGLGVMGEAGPEAVMPLVRIAGGQLGVQTEGGGQEGVLPLSRMANGKLGVNTTSYVAGDSSSTSTSSNKTSTTSVSMFATGGTFTNNTYSRPTLFKFAKERLGVMGEAGPEAVMPLSRTSDGQMGVEAEGGGRTNVLPLIRMANGNLGVDSTVAKTADQTEPASDLLMNSVGNVFGTSSFDSTSQKTANAIAGPAYTQKSVVDSSTATATQYTITVGDIIVQGGNTNEETAATLQKTMIETMRKVAQGEILSAKRYGGALA
jgi:lambda family phage tail tape measure protein